MLILGIDTSCDDTAASVVEDGAKIISNIVSSQDEVHKKYGGIVPELASRRHIEMILPVVDEALKKAGITFKDISAISVCKGPGLIGSLLVGVCFAKSLSFVHNIPLVAVNHLEGHVFSSFLNGVNPEFPFLALIVSGGHTSLYRVDGFGAYKELGRTRDDAAGEAYDKVAKLLGLGYPGGPIIDHLAQEGTPDAIDFPRAYLPGTSDFSFSGLKTAVKIEVEKIGRLEAEKRLLTSQPLRFSTPAVLNDIAASFQSAVIDVLIGKTVAAAKEQRLNSIALSGGVSANKSLREKITEHAPKEGIKVFLPPLYLCTDNAAMIAAAGFYHFKTGQLADFTLNPEAYLHL
ncbi:MAG: tRNA (adenosine(37)-N6)-threonylcarbamoyltransferase complex transferase subunit TsaD [Nitrospirae bacterium]|nr:tRNA (adenosine(37)-N6)-threonylcarbamoyltransferase complex transferase subunit TsaD [Nitrospirota bacterium]